MSEDKTQVQNQIGIVVKETMPAVSVATGTVEGLEPASPLAKPDPGLGISPVIPPDHSGLAGTGIQEYPPKVRSITGDGVTYSSRVGNQAGAEKLSEEKPDKGLTGEATVSYRQGLIYQLKRKLARAA